MEWLDAAFIPDWPVVFAIIQSGKRHGVAGFDGDPTMAESIFWIGLDVYADSSYGWLTPTVPYHFNNVAL